MSNENSISSYFWSAFVVSIKVSDCRLSVVWIEYFINLYLSHNMRFPTMWCVQRAKAQTSLRIRGVWSETSRLDILWLLSYWPNIIRNFLAFKKKAAQTRLSWITCRSSFIFLPTPALVINIWAVAWDFQQCGMCDQQKLRPACAYAQSDQSLC